MNLKFVCKPLAGICLALSICVGTAHAQSYPSKPVHIVVAFAPGGIADNIARLVGQGLGERLRQSVVVENRAGAGGVIASKSVAAAAADGYTLLAHTAAIAISASTSTDGFDPTVSLVPVALVASTPTIFAVNGADPSKTLQEFIRSRGGRFNYSTAGVGTPPHLTAEYLFKSLSGLDAVHVPFSGGAPAMTAVLGQQVDMISGALPPLIPNIRQGKLRVLAVASARRAETLPDVPTVVEAGLPAFEDLAWVAFFAPAKTSPAVVEKINGEINEVVKQPEFRERLKAIGFETTTSSPADLVQYMKNEVAKWVKVAKATGFTGN